MDKITLTLSPQAYNTIVQALQEIPWKVAQPVFQELDPQVRAALAKESAKESAKEPAPATQGAEGPKNDAPKRK